MRSKLLIRIKVRGLPAGCAKLFEDETDLLLFPPLRAGWFLRGKPAEVKDHLLPGSGRGVGRQLGPDAADREQYTAGPFYGSRRITRWLARHGHEVNRERVQRLRRLMGLEAVHPKPKRSAGRGHKV